VTRFQIERSFIDRYEVQSCRRAVSSGILDSRRDLEAFNEAIIGLIEIVHRFA